MVLWLYLKKIHIEIFTHTISGSCFRIICEGKSWSDRNEIRLILIIFETRWWVHQFNSVQSLSGVQLFVTTWTAACQASLSITNSRSLLRLMSIELVMPSSHLILCHPLLPLPPIPPSIRVFSNESTLRLRWPKYWSFSFSVSPSKEHPGLISFICKNW